MVEGSVLALEVASPLFHARQYRQLSLLSGILRPHFGHCMEKSSFNAMAIKIQSGFTQL